MKTYHTSKKGQKPNLIIGGVHKAGTTSLFMYLFQHPEICPSSKKEIHYFTPLRYGNPLAELSEYEKFFTHYKGEKYRLEASPSYLYGKKVISDRVFSTLEDPKMIFVLRNPSLRFISYYKHCKAKFMIPKETSLEEFYERSLENLVKEDKDDPFFRALREGMYSEFLKPWLTDHGPHIKIVFFEELIADPKTTMTEICVWLGLDPTFYKEYAFPIENKTVELKNERMRGIARFYNRKFEFFFRSHPTIKNFLRGVYSKMNHTDTQEPIPAETKDRIAAFYEDEKQQLSRLLAANHLPSFPGAWKNP